MFSLFDLESLFDSELIFNLLLSTTLDFEAEIFFFEFVEEFEAVLFCGFSGTTFLEVVFFENYFFEDTLDLVYFWEEFLVVLFLAGLIAFAASFLSANFLATTYFLSLLGVVEPVLF